MELMHDIYIDEKGPQEHIRVNDKSIQAKKMNDPSTRFKIGNDNMTDYAMAAIDVPEQNSDELKTAFEKLETCYLTHSENVTELKGYQILKGKKFTFGVASMPPREVSFYTNVVELLMNQDVKLCLVTQSKTASIITQRLHYWILEAAKRKKVSYSLLAYTLAKYTTIEASTSVLQELQSPDKSVYQILNIIKSDLKRFIQEYKSIPRMKVQNSAYADVLKVISKTQNIKTADVPHTGEFEWDKVAFSLNLWLLERQIFGENEKYRLFLDQGIKKEVFAVKPHSDIQYSDITEDCHSDKVYGIRLADLMATMFGKMMSKLTAAVLYNPEKPGESVYLPDEWFSLNQEQLNLVHLLHRFLIQTGLKYSFINDTFFDSAVHLQSYLTYISKFNDIKSLKQSNNGVEEFKVSKKMIDERFQKMRDLPKSLGRDPEQEILDGQLKPF